MSAVLKELLLGIDIGTTSVKALIVDCHGQVVAQSRQEYPSFYPQSGWAEQNPEDWWDAVKKAIRELVTKGNVSGERIKAIGVSGHGCAALPIDKTGKALRPAIIWMDKRAQEECREVKEHAGEFITKVNGYQIIPLRLEPKILWIRKHEKQVYNKTYKFISPTGYVNFKLTGNITVNQSDGGFYLAYNPARQNWSEEVCRALNISRNLYPDLFKCDQIIGNVNRQLSSETGLAPETPVVAGGEDTSSAPLGAGVSSPGQAYASMGTGSNVGVCTNDHLSHSELLVFPHVISGLFLLNAHIVEAGHVMEWAKSSLSGNIDMVDMDEEPSGMIFLPYIQGQTHPVYDLHAKGVIAGISTDSTKIRLLKAVMEGCSYSLLENIDAIKKLGGNISEIRITGAPANNRVWNQINADITGLDILVPEILEGAPLGNAVLAATGTGFFPDIKTAVRQMVRISEHVHPQAKFHQRYQKYYAIYRKMLKNMHEIFGEMSELH